MFPQTQKALFPVLFAINQPIHHHFSRLLTFPEIPFEKAINRIHSPLRVLRVVGGGLSLIPNSTSAPVRTSASSVLIAFDVQTIDGSRWNARMISNERNACEVFLMDSVTLQRKATLKMSVATRGIGHSISANLTLFDFSTLMYSSVWLMAMISSSSLKCNHGARVRRNFELHLHRMYKQMVTRGVDFRCKGSKHKRSVVVEHMYFLLSFAVSISLTAYIYSNISISLSIYYLINLFVSNPAAHTSSPVAP